MRRSGPPRRRTGLARRTPLARSSALARSEPRRRSGQLRPRSPQTRERDRRYGQLHIVWFGDSPVCAAAGLLPQVECSGIATDVHHTMGRSARYMLDVATWLRLCRPCHRWVTDHPAEARAAGLSRHRRGEPPSMDAFAHCRSCHRPIYWAITTSGERIPLQADKETRKPVEFLDDGTPGRIVAASSALTLFDGSPSTSTDLQVRVLTDGEGVAVGEQVWLSHFVDCPFSDKHRKSRR